MGVIAFYSNSYPPSPNTCDGFYEYSWGSTAVMRWTRGNEGQWQRAKAGTVTWINETEFAFKPEE